MTVDPRIELLNVIVYLGEFRGFAGNSPLTSLASPYLEDVEKRFGPYRRHPVVARYEQMAQQGFWLTHPPSAVLHLGDPPDLLERIPVNDFTVRKAGGRSPLDAFFVDMRDFAAESEFIEWFQGKAEIPGRIVDRYRRRMEWDHVEDLVDYSGDRLESYTLILAPLSHGGGFGPRVVRPDGRYDAFAVIGPRAVDGTEFDFGSAGGCGRASGTSSHTSM